MQQSLPESHDPWTHDEPESLLEQVAGGSPPLVVVWHFPHAPNVIAEAALMVLAFPQKGV